MMITRSTMPFFLQRRDVTSSGSIHEKAPDGIISLSWAFLIIPCIFLVGAFLWIAVNFSQPSEFPEDDTQGNADQDDGVENDEKDQLLDAFQLQQSSNVTRQSASSWKINSKYSSTSRGGSIFTTYPDPNAPHRSPVTSPTSKRSSASHPKVVGSKAAKVLTLNKDRMMLDLERLDPIDREELQRSSSRASSIRKSD